MAWSIDAALLMPLVLLLSWGKIAPAAADLGLQANALLTLAAQAMAAAIVAGTGPALLPAGILHDAGVVGAVSAVHAASWALLWPPIAVFALLGALYHGALDSSAWQGSAGKRLLGLRVRDGHGQPLRFVHALTRHFAGALSWLTFNLGHALAAVGPGHRALHDRCTGTQVVAGQDRLPRWSRVWLALVAATAVAALVWIMGEALETMRLALEQALY